MEEHFLKGLVGLVLFGRPGWGTLRELGHTKPYEAMRIGVCFASSSFWIYKSLLTQDPSDPSTKENLATSLLYVKFVIPQQTIPGLITDRQTCHLD